MAVGEVQMAQSRALPKDKGVGEGMLVIKNHVHTHDLYTQVYGLGMFVVILFYGDLFTYFSYLDQVYSFIFTFIRDRVL